MKSRNSNLTVSEFRTRRNHWISRKIYDTPSPISLSSLLFCPSAKRTAWSFRGLHLPPAILLQINRL